MGGGRVSGKAGKFNVGLLNMQTSDYDDIVASTNFSVARVSRDLPNRSSIGAIVTNRQATGDLAGDNEYGRTFGVDGKIGIGLTTVVSGFAAKTETPGVRRERSRVQHSIADQSPAVGPQRRLPGSRQRLQPCDRFPQPPRLPQARRESDDAFPSRRTSSTSRSCVRMRRSAASGVSTDSRKPGSCISTTTGSFATAPRSTPA